MFKKALLAAMLSCSLTAWAVPFSSQHALVFDEETGQVLLEKDAHAVVPIASLTKLMTAMVVLDAKQDMDELIAIDESDVDTLKNSSSRVPVGAVLPRHTVLQLALMSSDNRAAAALGRTYPGGHIAFLDAVRSKLQALGMTDTSIQEPTGLSPHNRSTAADLLKMATAASYYPEISRLTTETAELVDINGKPVQYRNTNGLVGKKGWDILLSKTGFTREAGRCLIMRMQAAGRHVILVLLNAKETAYRVLDAENVQRYLSGQPPLEARALFAHHGVKQVAARKHGKSKSGVVLVKAKAAVKASRKGRTV
ncbi:D-alanyl-D-alanine carboxypeptidase/D-alanyl-D-alanine endopeptidase (penicillin-binding protein 7) [Noviherbaspirillum humi]|uniref:D-alanyl-D-alanine carboxypeptidase/D-alanyl-D-alanine endopeptidase (Penicillin-binding protein 7) n=1 Tax=Noviherbaspirillum humi TaxID=1688639 RepID=A0A239HDY4_9BURK|nr:serine hydrolase [Noviherbaspirillum humi]SNS79345.1 D-alanyl-D-alanine carboxypeptidase/D-alanyl-D-alanine endopeptidase (penicillin-binding protein 7) [Noviherbaspirillum humi]